MGGAKVLINKVARRVGRARDRLTGRVAPRLSIDHGFTLDGAIFAIGWHEAPDMTVRAGRSRRNLETLRVLRFHRPDLIPMLGPNNLAGFAAISANSSSASNTADIVVRIGTGTTRTFTQRRPALVAPYETIVDIAERLIASGALDRQSAVRVLVLPALRHRVAAQRANSAPTVCKYRAGHYPESCALNVVVPFYGSFGFAQNILAVLSLISGRDLEGGLAVTFVCDDPRMESNFVDFVRSQNESVNRLPLAVYSHPINRGFAAACNTGAAATRGAVTIFLNSDVIASGPETLVRLAQTVAGDPTIAAASPTLLFPDGMLQARELVTFENPLFPGFTLLEPPCKGLHITGTFPDVEDADLLPGAMLAVRTAAFDQVGGFSLDFGSGDFEDAELCTRLRALGRLVVINATALHLEGHSYQRKVLEVLARAEIFRELCSR
jgi:GT2 family glycosyltransferase